MILTRLQLHDWRCYSSLDLNFSNKVTIVTGANGEGKSNLVEAIYYLSLAHSWRSDDEKPLIRIGSSTATIVAEVVEGDLHRTIEINLSTGKKRIAINGKAIHRLSELSKITNVLLFTPSDTTLFVGAPRERRNFLDIALSKQSSEYFSLIGDYSHLLAERNATLKSEAINYSYLDVLLDEMLSKEKQICAYRVDYLAKLNQVIVPLANTLYGEKRPLQIVYKPFVPLDDEFIHNAKEAYKRALESDVFHKSTSLGVQREDWQAFYSGVNLGLYGSQGENRLAAIILKIAPYYLIEDPAKKPITVLDDVYSELDEVHSQRLNQLINSLGQCFISSATRNINATSIIEVADHKAIRRN